MKKLWWMVGLVLMTTIVYAQQIKSIKRVDLLKDGVIFNGEEKLAFGMDEARIVALLGDYERKGRADYPSTSLDFLEYLKDFGLEVVVAGDSFYTIQLGDERANYPLYLDGKKLFIGQKNDKAKKLLNEYKIIRVSETNKSYHKNKFQRVTYAVGDNYLDVDYSYDTNLVVKISYGTFYFY